MTTEPTLVPNEFKIIEWSATFLFVTSDKLSIDNAKFLIDKEIKKQFEIFITQKIKNRHHTIALIPNVK